MAAESARELERSALPERATLAAEGAPPPLIDTVLLVAPLTGLNFTNTFWLVKAVPVRVNESVYVPAVVVEI